MCVKEHGANFTEPYKLRGYGKNFQGCIGTTKEYAAMLCVRLCVRFSIGIDIPSSPWWITTRVYNAHIARLPISCLLLGRKASTFQTAH